jgi:hypothetical protein
MREKCTDRLLQKRGKSFSAQAGPRQEALFYIFCTCKNVDVQGYRCKHGTASGSRDGGDSGPGESKEEGQLEPAAGQVSMAVIEILCKEF